MVDSPESLADEGYSDYPDKVLLSTPANSLILQESDIPDLCRADLCHEYRHLWRSHRKLEIVVTAIAAPISAFIIALAVFLVGGGPIGWGAILAGVAAAVLSVPVVLSTIYMYYRIYEAPRTLYEKSKRELIKTQADLGAQRGIVGQYATWLTEANYEKSSLQDEVSALRQQLTIWEINSRNDRQDINKMIHSWNPTIDGHDFDVSTPWIQFDFYIFNGSMFAVAVDDTAGGFITYGDRRLKGQLSREKQWRVDNLYRGWTARIKVRLWLDADDALYLKTELRQPETNPTKFFGLRNLEIVVRGSTQGVLPDPGIAPKPLTLNFGGVDKNQRSR